MLRSALLGLPILLAGESAHAEDLVATPLYGPQVPYSKVEALEECEIPESAQLVRNGGCYGAFHEEYSPDDEFQEWVSQTGFDVGLTMGRLANRLEIEPGVMEAHCLDASTQVLDWTYSYGCDENLGTFDGYSGRFAGDFDHLEQEQCHEWVHLILDGGEEINLEDSVLAEGIADLACGAALDTYDHKYVVYELMALMIDPEIVQHSFEDEYYYDSLTCYWEDFQDVDDVLLKGFEDTARLWNLEPGSEATLQQIYCEDFRDGVDSVFDRQIKWYQLQNLMDANGVDWEEFLAYYFPSESAYSAWFDYDLVLYESY